MHVTRLWLIGALPLIALQALLAMFLLVAPQAALASHGPHYPDLRTLPPDDLRFDTVSIDGLSRQVLRFSNTVWNAGQGPLELVAKNDRARKKTQVFQRVYRAPSASGAYDEHHVGTFELHPGHNHFHFGSFAEYQLWESTTWDDWVADGRPTGTERSLLRGQGEKTTFCIMDTEQVDGSLTGSPSGAAYGTCGRTRQGLSVGWGDTYGWQLADQWVVLPGSGLTEGREYVLRSVADPLNVLYESAGRSGSSVESRQANEAIVRFRVENGAIVGL